jgi:hypothetical protein
MTIFIAKQFARREMLKDWGCYADRSERDIACLERGFEAGIEHFRKTMKAQLDLLFKNDLVLKMGKTEILNFLDVQFETKT